MKKGSVLSTVGASVLGIALGLGALYSSDRFFGSRFNTENDHSSIQLVAAIKNYKLASAELQRERDLSYTELQREFEQVTSRFDDISAKIENSKNTSPEPVLEITVTYRKKDTKFGPSNLK